MRQHSGLPPALEQRVEVETPEQVVFEYEIAGVGSRSVAAIIDYAILVLLLLVILVLGVAAGVIGSFISAVGGVSGWVGALIFAAIFLVNWGYFVLFEALSNGQTPGKRMVGLRVVRDGGFSVGWQESAIRNLVRIVDLQPGVTFAVGLISVALSSSGKRIGDYVAGTIVVKERFLKTPAVSATSSAQKTMTAAAGSAPAPLPVSALLSEDEYALLDRFIARRASLRWERRELFEQQLAARFEGRLPGGKDADISARLSELHENERTLRARGIAARSDTGAAREQHALVASGVEKWSGYAERLAAARKRGLRNLSEVEVADLAARYREASTDLARLRTAARGRDSDAASYLGRLVAEGHNLLYRERQLVPVLMWKFVAHTIPAEMRRSVRPIMLAVLFFFGPMLVTQFHVTRNPDSAAALLGAEMLNRAATARDREAAGEGYLPAEMAASRGPLLATRLATNNVRVAYLAFAFGVTAGIGTLLLLFFNGVSIGAALGVFAGYDALHMILAFVAPHGALELSAICIAGGAGLLVGSSFVLPGAVTRREALISRGRRAVVLVAGATLMLAVAALIEGFVSPLNLPLPAAYAISGATALAGLLYLLSGRSPAKEEGEHPRRAGKHFPG